MKRFMDNEIFLNPYNDPQQECTTQAAQTRAVVMGWSVFFPYVWVRKAQFIFLQEQPNQSISFEIRGKIEASSICLKFYKIFLPKTLISRSRSRGMKISQDISSRSNMNVTPRLCHRGLLSNEVLLQHIHREIIHIYGELSVDKRPRRFHFTQQPQIYCL